ncbi:MAG: leucine-rich repeat protein [Lachnospiraceae bacterium]|jgi:beta-galactosidase|nr:leucine-rich repeat protein [Lachnospiraceae bacterium]
MKQRFKQLLAVLLATSLCIPAVPADKVQAETAQTQTAQSEIVWTEEEKISAAQINENERFINFNEEWKFYFGDSSTAQNVNFLDASWQEVNLPHDFSITQEFTERGEAESGFLLGGTGWYRKKFSLPESFQGKSIVLNFDGVYKDTDVYVNGTKVGEHHYGYTPFSFDISEYLNYDGITENVIAVKVVNNIPSSRWYSGSGIYRDVTLIVANPVHVDVNGTFITTPNLQTSNGSDGTVNVAVDVKNSSQAATDISIRNTIYEKGSTTSVATNETTASLAADETKSVTTSLKVDAPKLWSMNEPNLYTVQTELIQDGTVIDTYDTEFGFKWYEFVDNTGFKLNGQNLKINGVCMHHDQGALGAAAYYDAIYRQMSIMKNMGVNTIRVTHNPASKTLIQICNELGLLVIEEFFDGWAWPKNGNTNDFSAYFNTNLTDDNHIIGGSPSMTWSEFALKSLVKRDRNDVSIILWSLGNEIQEGTSEGDLPWGEHADNLIRWTKELDTTHPVTSGSNRKNLTDYVAPVTQKIYEAGGVPGYNYGNINDITTLHNTYPVLLWSETASAINSRGVYTDDSMGTSAIGGHLTSYDESCVGWGKTAHASMYPTLSNDFIAGECVWTGFDYIGEPTPWNGTGTGIHSEAPNKQIAAPNSSYFGIVETTGFPKDNYYLYRSQWNKNANTLHLVTAWDPDNMKTSNGKTPVWVYSNAAKVELYLNNQKIGTATRKALNNTTTSAGHTRYEYTTESNNSSVCTTSSGSGDQSLYSVFQVAFSAGTISAKAYDEKGAEITNTCEGNSSITTPGAAAKLIAVSDKDSIDADGSSLSYITVDVTDANGNLKTKADNTIQFSLTGNGEIVGVDNGDQATVDKYQQKSVLIDSKTAQIKAYAGKALVIVRSTKNSGSFTLTASSAQLTESSVTVQTNAVGNTTETSVASYTMARHGYLPVGSSEAAVRLPETVTALLTDHTEKTFSVKWNDYDKSILNTKGNYRIDGSITNGSQTINVSVLLHVYAPIIGVQNHSLCTAPKVLPTLPSVSMAYDVDGDAFEEYPITWNTDGLNNSSFAEMNAIIPIEGTVTIFGKEYKTTASVRVATPNVTYTNVGVNRDHLVDNAFENGTKTTDGVPSYDDTLTAVTDGSRPDSGWSPSRWSDYGHRSNSNPQTNIQIAMDWATVTTTDKIDIYYFTGGGAVLPNAIKFEYTSTSNYNEANRFLDAQWTEIPHTGPVDIQAEGLGNATVGKSYQLAELINPQAIRITFGHAGSSFMGINEIEVMHPTYTYDLNSNASLSGVSLGENQTITFNDTENVYSIPDDWNFSDIGALTYENPNNAAVTVLKRNDSLVKIISVSEDGKNAKEYTIKSNKDDPTPETKKLLMDKITEYKALDAKLYDENTYQTFMALVQGAESTIDTLTESKLLEKLAELNQAYGELVQKSLEQAVASYEQLDPEEYTPESYKPLKELLDAVKGNIDSMDVQTQQEHLTQLADAFKNLVKKDEPGDDEKGPWTITFVANNTGVSNMPSKITGIEDGKTVKQPSAKPKKANYDFVCWSESKNGSKYDWSKPVTKNLTLYAQWKPTTHYIKFDANGGKGAPSRIAVSYGSKAKQPKDKPTRKGYTFIGWSTKRNGSVYDWSSAVKKDMTLYAKWKSKNPPLKNGTKMTDSKSKITYKVISASKKTVMVLQGKNKKATKVTIPKTVQVNGVSCKVVEIGKNAFKGYTKLTTVSIGKNVKLINKNAFYDCKKLKKITYQNTTAPSIKTGAFKKTSSKITVNVPKSMKSKERKKFLNALKKAGASKKSQIK